MIRNLRKSACLALLGVLLTQTMSVARTPLTGNLLQNPSFEPDLTAWTTVTGMPLSVSYDDPGALTSAVSNRIGGGFKHLRGNAVSTIVEQVVVTGPIPAGTNARARGYFGGQGPNNARMFLVYLSATGLELGQSTLATVTPVERNSESVLMYQAGTFAIPQGTERIAVRIDLTRTDCCSSFQGAADGVSLELVTSSTTPPPLPYDTELIVNRDFESGWAAGSPLTLVDAQGWYGAGSTSAVAPYSDSNPNVPSTTVSCLIEGGLAGTSCLPGGAGNLFSDAGGNAVLRQHFDVRGNAFSGSGAAFRISAFIGGVSTIEDTAQIDVKFINASNVQIASTRVGPVTRAHRNSQTVLLLREQEYLIPAGTTFIDVDVMCTNIGCCDGAHGLVDNVSAMIVAPSGIEAAPLGVNLVHNGGFESGSLSGSPLDLLDPNGWQGDNASNVEVLQYGASAEAPPGSFANTNGLGGFVLSDLGGNASFSQTVDLRGNYALIAASLLRVNVLCWLGGFGTSTDSGFLSIQFVNLVGAPIGPLNTLGPVTPLERENSLTLRPKTGDYVVPAGTARMIVSVHFGNTYCCDPAYGLADAISVIAYDLSTAGFSFCPGDGSGTACPCLNSSATGAAEGCRNSTGVGGRLRGQGVARLSADSLRLEGSQMPNSTALYFQGTAPQSSGAGSVFGDGLRCAGGTLVRLAVKNNVGGSSQYPDVGDPSVSAGGFVLEPGLRTYQVWYRNAAAFCTSSTFNLTNGWEVIWNW